MVGSQKKPIFSQKTSLATQNIEFNTFLSLNLDFKYHTNGLNYSRGHVVMPQSVILRKNAADVIEITVARPPNSLYYGCN